MSAQLKEAQQKDPRSRDICQLLKEFHGKCPVMIEYLSDNASGNIPLKSEYDVSLHRNLLDALDKNLGQGKYKIQYYYLVVFLEDFLIHFNYFKFHFKNCIH